ncbi:hypothetical protein WMY93_007772 [Mugilogobius chulae]|uniref:FHF complex subunit HOOK-interacting protein C-terminal domain-containing protein n=1 Tax=Mugilogobius chulae TaxID=88201 RepID=A0AAW0PQG2_9GOBI
MPGSVYENSNLDRGGSRKKKIEDFSRSSREKLVQSKNKMFSKFTSILQHAVEALAPSLPLQEDFVYHWKAITHYYIETSDDKAPVTDTNIPSHLEQMLDILTQEEAEHESGETGPCMEYLLHQKYLRLFTLLGRQIIGQKDPTLFLLEGHREVKIMLYPLTLAKLRYLKRQRSHRQLLLRLVQPRTITTQQLQPGHVIAQPHQKPRWQDVVKACEGLMLLVSLPEPAAAKCLTESTELCELLTDRLVSFYKALPQSMDPLDIETVESVNWGLDVYNLKEDAAVFTGKRALISFLSWLDYCDQLIKEAQKSAATVMAKAVRERFFVAVMESQLMQTSEVGILTSTALLNRIIRQVSSEALMQEMVYFLLGEEKDSETALEERNYLENKPQDEREPLENGQPHDAVDLEEDPLFGDDLSPDSRLSGSDWLSTSPPLSPDHSRSEGKTEVHKIVNSFLCLVPDEAKSSYHVEGTGYDTYLRDAHRQFKDYCGVCQRWDWRGHPKPLEKCNLDLPFFEGHFLKVLFDRMGRILDQPYDVNLQVTAVLSKLSLLPHPHLHEYLLDPYINLAPGCRSLFSVIVRVVGDLMLRIQRIPDFTPKLLLVRKRLLGLEPEGLNIDHMTLLEGVIVLEEFCKELAAIAFVKYHATASSSP